MPQWDLGGWHCLVNASSPHHSCSMTAERANQPGMTAGSTPAKRLDCSYDDSELLGAVLGSPDPVLPCTQQWESPAHLYISSLLWRGVKSWSRDATVWCGLTQVSLFGKWKTLWSLSGCPCSSLTGALVLSADASRAAVSSHCAWPSKKLDKERFFV